MFVVIMGPPGVGKGTQCKRLVQWLNIPHVSTGDMLREARKALPPSDVLARMDGGNLVADEVAIDLVRRRLELPDCHRGCLLDGFPRTTAQAEALDEMLAERGRQVAVAVKLDGDDDQLIQRMLSRATKENRPDDTVETLARRMEVYRQQTLPVAQYYQRQGVLRSVNAGGTPDEVFVAIQAAIPDVDSPGEPNGGT